MTREEAIEILKQPGRIGCNLIKANDEESIKYNQESIEALAMAIKVLEQEPKTGHWIIKEGREQGYDIAGIKTWYIQIMCDKCGFIKTAIEGHTGQYHYCPNCGAKMEEE